MKRLREAEEDSTDASDYLIRANPTQSSQTVSAAPAATLIPLTPESEDIPDLIVYETSYANYPLILASGGIKRAGGQAHLQFSPLKVQEDGTELRPSSDVDVSIYIDLRAVIEVNDKITWVRAENGNILTQGDAKGAIDKKYWKRAVARRADIGILYEDGEVRKEVPIGLRGKGVKGKRGSGKSKARGLKEMKATSEDDSTGSD
jgi:2'-phosphotransferase